ncbi:hypothetical protein Hdeb2414_s0024g00650321 [Helianthus debilis subsp. tardiflorus]
MREGGSKRRKEQNSDVGAAGAASPTLGSSWPTPYLAVYAPADAGSPVSSFSSIPNTVIPFLSPIKLP